MSFFVGFVLCFFHKCHNRRVAKTVSILFFLPQSLQRNLPKVSRITDHKNANITFTSLSYIHIILYGRGKVNRQYAQTFPLRALYICAVCTKRPGSANNSWHCRIREFCSPIRNTLHHKTQAILLLRGFVFVSSNNS